AYHHKGLSFVRIIQRCPEWLPNAFEPWMQDPQRLRMLVHKDGLKMSDSLAKVYKNQEEHDPANMNRAREIASDQDPIPVGILYRNEQVPCYEELRASDKLRTPEYIQAGLHAEFDKFTIWPEASATPAQH
ncbi:MAG: hypothetical protein ACXWVP_05055, partial [Burkholderiales bacterium]